MIRKNSPNKHKNAVCEFHSHSRNPILSSNGISMESSLTKKFNYTNWRKTNNNLMVWRASGPTNNNKTISLNR